MEIQVNVALWVVQVFLALAFFGIVAALVAFGRLVVAPF